MHKGRVINLNGGLYTVLDEDSNEIKCRARGKLRYVKVDKFSKFNVNKNKLGSKLDKGFIKVSPRVGDIVDFEILDGTNHIIDVLERKNELIRPEVSNVDQILLIFAAKNPDFSLLLLDMFLVNLHKQNVTPVIIITKIDLLSINEFDDLKQDMSYYEKIGYKVIFINSKNPTNKDEIISLFKDKVSVLSGQTGAGKSTLINALIPGFTLNTQEISKALGRGKHTTREVTLYSYHEGLIGDTPGFSKLEISSIDKQDLKKYFVEFNDYKCRFKDCIHLSNSLGCAIKDNEEIKKSRYNNYLKMLNDIKDGSKR